MNAEINGNMVVVTLSRRNLQALLAKLDEPNSAKSIIRECDSCDILVKAEEDDIHYGDRNPGPMSDRTENTIRRMRGEA